MPKADKSNLYLYNRTLKEYARENRNKANKAECCLWKFVLSAKRMKGSPKTCIKLYSRLHV